MNLQRTPNAWSCLPAAFATALDVPVARVIDLVHHDGSEVIWPELPEPYRRRSFHIQEMIDVCYLMGHVVTPFEARPALRPRGTRELIEIGMYPGNAHRINRYLELGRGVLTGENLSGRPHAVAWDSSLVWDPSDRNGSYERHLFAIETFWMLTRATSGDFKSRA